MTSLTIEQVRAVGLPKWPGLLVIGESVSADLAAEIIIRTDRWTFLTNDRPWKGIIAEELGIDIDQYEMFPYEKMWDKGQEYGVLELAYLHNEQVASCYIGGPHGWVDWGGRVGCNSWNIGKWPSATRVFREWEAIAEAFPALSLRCQLLNHENGYPGENPGPAIEYVVKDGRVEAFLPISQLVESAEDNFDPVAFAEILNGGTEERGCTLESFKHALSLARGKVAPKVRHLSSDYGD